MKRKDQLIEKALPFLKEYYSNTDPTWSEEWERKYQLWLDMLEDAGFTLEDGMR